VSSSDRESGGILLWFVSNPVLANFIMLIPNRRYVTHKQIRAVRIRSHIDRRKLHAFIPLRLSPQ